MPVAEDRGQDDADTHAAERARDAERLRALEQRLAEQRLDDRLRTPGADKFAHANQAWRMVVELVAGLAIGFGFGYGLDWLLGTTPIMLVIFILLGFAAGVKTMLRTAAEMGDKPGTPAAQTQPGRPAEHTTPALLAETKGTERGD
ncbi:MAG TPA: AtpZ/AtpI family protein [Paracoccus sp. (in: a-proteobacteria)]|nr:AtpZ/AtpI family protein [Paracoccus sp. (in: a-proteobacteria)]